MQLELQNQYRDGGSSSIGGGGKAPRQKVTSKAAIFV